MLRAQSKANCAYFCAPRSSRMARGTPNRVIQGSFGRRWTRITSQRQDLFHAAHRTTKTLRLRRILAASFHTRLCPVSGRDLLFGSIWFIEFLEGFSTGHQTIALAVE